VVESDFGYHIIQVTDIKTPKQKSFEELRASLEEDLKSQQARAKYAEAAEAFTNGVYEQSDSLKPVADRLKLEIKTASDVKRTVSPGTQGVLANAKLLAAVFNPESVEKKRNSEAVEIAPSQLAAARITQYTAARTLPLAEVRASVQQRVVASRAAELAKKEGEQKLVAWKASPATATLLSAQEVSRDQPKGLPAVVLSAVMRVDSSNLPAWVGVDLQAQGYVVAKVNKLTPRATQTAELQKQDREQVAKFWAVAENQAYYKWLKDRLKVQIKVNRPSNTLLDAAQSAVS
jgi:peptidyl-prolyl cis-trans isomerase D